MNEAYEIIEKLSLTASAIEDLAGLLSSSSDQDMGGACLWLLHQKLEEDIDKLSEIMQNKIEVALNAQPISM
jgi:hypothetical protein